MFNNDHRVRLQGTNFLSSFCTVCLRCILVRCDVIIIIPKNYRNYWLAINKAIILIFISDKYRYIYIHDIILYENDR